MIGLKWLTNVRNLLCSFMCFWSHKSPKKYFEEVKYAKIIQQLLIYLLSSRSRLDYRTENKINKLIKGAF